MFHIVSILSFCDEHITKITITRQKTDESGVETKKTSFGGKKRKKKIKNLKKTKKNVKKTDFNRSFFSVILFHHFTVYASAQSDVERVFSKLFFFASSAILHFKSIFHILFIFLFICF